MLSKAKLNRLRKDLRSFIKDFFSFSIVFHVNIKVVNFLDVTLELKIGLYCPFCKLNKIISYINVMSNHPKYVIDGIAKTVFIRMSNSSANEDIFNKDAPIYTNALRLSDFKSDISYIPNTWFKNSLADLLMDSEVTDYLKFASPCVHHRRGIYFSTTSTVNGDCRKRRRREFR